MMRFVCEESCCTPHNKDLFNKYSISIRGDQLCRFVSSELMLQSLPEKVGSLMRNLLLPFVAKAGKILPR